MIKINHSGSALIQALVVVALLAAVSATVILNTGSSSQSIKRTRVKAEAMRMAQAVAANALDSDLCRVNFRISPAMNSNAGGATGISSAPISADTFLRNATATQRQNIQVQIQMRNFSNNTSGSSTWLPAQNNGSFLSGNFKLESIIFREDPVAVANPALPTPAPLPPNTYKGKLYIQVSDASRNPIALAPYETDFEITTSASAAPNGVGSCQANPTGRSLCESRLGNWDPTKTPKCQFNIDQMNCPDDGGDPSASRKFIKDIGPDGKPICADFEVKCPANSYIQGFDASGDPICARFVAAAAAAPGICLNNGEVIAIFATGGNVNLNPKVSTPANPPDVFTQAWQNSQCCTGQSYSGGASTQIIGWDVGPGSLLPVSETPVICGSAPPPVPGNCNAGPLVWQKLYSETIDDMVIGAFGNSNTCPWPNANMGIEPPADLTCAIEAAECDGGRLVGTSQSIWGYKCSRCPVASVSPPVLACANGSGRVISGTQQTRYTCNGGGANPGTPPPVGSSNDAAKSGNIGLSPCDAQANLLALNTYCYTRETDVCVGGGITLLEWRACIAN